jgi:hypothetical protein
MTHIHKATAISDAFTRAGYDTITASLRQLIADAMKQTNNNVPRALERFDRAALSRDQIAEIKRSYFVANLPAARDQSGAESQATYVSPAKQPGGGHHANDF